MKETYSVDIPYDADNTVAPAAAVYPKTRPIISLSLSLSLSLSHSREYKNLSCCVLFVDGCTHTCGVAVIRGWKCDVFKDGGACLR